MREPRRTLLAKTSLGLAALFTLSIVASAPAQAEPHARLDELWNATVRPFLRDPLWRAEYAYDAGHHLMVPLFAAFTMPRRDWQHDLATHYARFVADSPALAAGRLDRLQYLYAASWFAVLAHDSGRADLVPARLMTILRRDIESAWSGEPAWQWGRKPFPGGMRERLRWKLATRDVQRSYYRAIIDEELYLMGLAANALVLERAAGRPAPVLEEILCVTAETFRSEVRWGADGGWLLQPGVWRDHPDYGAARESERVPNPKALAAGFLRLPDVGTDVSHSHRLPLWLASFWRAAGRGSSEEQLFTRLREGLAIQFTTRVLVPPSEYFPTFRTRNFMDGANGWYRWGYRTLGSNAGYAPFALSGTFLLGWWSLLEDPLVRHAYADVARAFPLSCLVLETYCGPATSRRRHALVDDAAVFTNGFRELLVRLAAALPDYTTFALESKR